VGHQSGERASGGDTSTISGLLVIVAVIYLVMVGGVFPVNG
jgi:hypothetical protein